MITKKIVRSPVFVMENAERGVYEITETGEYIINICQVDCWWEGSKYCDLVRKVPIRVTEQVYKVGMELPGSICIGLTETPLDEDNIEDGLWLDEHGEIQYGDNGPIYGFWYYCPDCMYLSIGVQIHDDVVNKFRSKIK